MRIQHASPLCSFCFEDRHDHRLLFLISLLYYNTSEPCDCHDCESLSGYFTLIFTVTVFVAA